MPEKLGRLEKVDLRTVWESEPKDFTPWLAREENIRFIGDAIGLDLEVEAQEKSVGPFRADILCKDLDSGNWVLIENQLDVTDHKHLGQLLTYATGLEAAVIVWVAGSFSAEHRATLDWLNEITEARFGFFGLEIELWRIGESPVAPKFNVVSRPNDWTRAVSSAARSLEAEKVGPIMAKQIGYWTSFNEVLKRTKGQFKPKNPLAGDFMTFGSGVGVAPLIVFATSKRIACGLVLRPPLAKPLFRTLARDRVEIEREFGGPLDWREMEDRKESQVLVRLEGASLLDEGDWPRQHEWLLRSLQRLHRTFSQRLPAAVEEASTAVDEDG